MDSDITACLKSWSNELTARADRVRALIGDKHWLSDGHHKEYVLREFLSRHLPNHVTVARGFIRPPDPQNPVSREIDIMLSDYALHPPWFNEGGLVIVPPTAVVAQLQVKTLLGSVEFADVMDGIVAGNIALENYVEPTSVWAGGLFFRWNPKPASAFQETLQKWVHSFAQRWQQRKLAPIDFPNCLAALSGPVVFFDRTSRKAGTLRIKAFDCAQLAPAVLLADLFEHLRTMGGLPNKRGALSTVLERAGFAPIFSHDMQIRP